MTKEQEFHCDVLVVGSGAAGMSAAVSAAHQGLNVLIVEKAARFGGTAARSGGWVWIPGSDQAKAWGHLDSIESVKRYLKNEGGASYN